MAAFCFHVFFVVPRSSSQPRTKVLNYEMPTGKNALLNYVHRIGRTGRGGRQDYLLSLRPSSFARFLNDSISGFAGSMIRAYERALLG